MVQKYCLKVQPSKQGASTSQTDNRRTCDDITRPKKAENETMFGNCAQVSID